MDRPDFPQLTKTVGYSSSVFNPLLADRPDFNSNVVMGGADHLRFHPAADPKRRLNPFQQDLVNKMLEEVNAPQAAQQPKKVKAMPTLRIVKVVIADPNPSLPLDKRVLYSGPETTTDATDQELFYELPIKQLLDDHNAVRTATPDKSRPTGPNSEPHMLEPLRIRDLKMVVIDIATF